MPEDKVVNSFDDFLNTGSFENANCSIGNMTEDIRGACCTKGCAVVEVNVTIPGDDNMRLVRWVDGDDAKHLFYIVN